MFQPSARNFCSKARELITKRYSLCIKKVSAVLRHALKNSSERLRISVSSAIKYRRTQTCENNEKVLNVKKDIENMINHVSGEHKSYK